MWFKNYLNFILPSLSVHEVAHSFGERTNAWCRECILLFINTTSRLRGSRSLTVCIEFTLAVNCADTCLTRQDIQLERVRRSSGALR
jgi:hypothetical protein